MEKADVSELGRRLIKLFTGDSIQQLGGMTKSAETLRWRRGGARQDCVTSPLLFNLYSEFMIKEVMESIEGIKFNGMSITNLRYADGTGLAADNLKTMQRMVDMGRHGM